MKKHWKIYLLGSLASLNLFVWVQVYKVSHRELTVAFLNVGQGDAIFIETPNGNQMLIDGGPNDSVLRELGAVMPFYDRSIDIVLATHPDADHIFGLPEVFDRFRIDAYISSGALSGSDVYKALVSNVEDEEANVLIVKSGDRIILEDDIYLDILSPEENANLKEMNEYSIVARLVYKDFEVMLTGDAPAWIENKVAIGVDDSLLKSDILKVSHHGSKTSSSELFLTKVDPDLAIISSGLNNRYGHPHEVITERLKNLGIEIKNTAFDGRITIQSDGATYEII